MFWIIAIIMLISILVFSWFYAYTTKEYFSENYFRGYALKKSLEIWRDKPILGFGPGTYGGVVSFVYNSPIYEKYNFSEEWFNYMSSFRSLDPIRKKFLLGFSIVPVVLATYLFGSGLNLTPFLLTYSTLFGMFLGMRDENSFNQ